MIKKLRFRFILVSLLSILFVLSSTIGAINIYNYTKIERDSEVTLNQAINNGFDDEPMMDGPAQQDKGPRENRLIAERYFVVSFNSDGTINQSNFKHIFSVSDTYGKQLATDVYNGSQTKGKVDYFRYKKEIKNDLTFVAFVDVREQYDTARNFLVTSVVVSSISYLVLVALIVVASFLVFKPSEESYKKQKRFITNASHELKTPLTIISTDLEIIEMDNGKSEWTESIKDQVNRLTTMTNQLVTLSKMDEEDMKNYPFEDFSLTDLAKQCIESFSPSFKKQEFDLSRDVEEGIKYHGNKYLIDELFYIFLDNALKYSKENGKVSIFVQKASKNRINLLFLNDIEENNGIDVDQLFDRFYRSPNAQKTGSGIGLSIAQEIVRIHKGKINAKIENNQIIFSILLWKII